MDVKTGQDHYAGTSPFRHAEDRLRRRRRIACLGCLVPFLLLLLIAGWWLERGASDGLLARYISPHPLWYVEIDAPSQFLKTAESSKTPAMQANPLFASAQAAFMEYATARLGNVRALDVQDLIAQANRAAFAVLPGRDGGKRWILSLQGEPEPLLHFLQDDMRLQMESLRMEGKVVHTLAIPEQEPLFCFPHRDVLLLTDDSDLMEYALECMQKKRVSLASAMAYPEGIRDMRIWGGGIPKSAFPLDNYGEPLLGLLELPEAGFAWFGVAASDEIIIHLTDASASSEEETDGQPSALWRGVPVKASRACWLAKPEKGQRGVLPEGVADGACKELFLQLKREMVALWFSQEAGAAMVLVPATDESFVDSVELWVRKQGGVLSHDRMGEEKMLVASDARGDLLVCALQRDGYFCFAQTPTSLQLYRNAMQSGTKNVLDLLPADTKTELLGFRQLSRSSEMDATNANEGGWVATMTRNPGVPQVRVQMQNLLIGNDTNRSDASTPDGVLGVLWMLVSGLFWFCLYCLAGLIALVLLLALYFHVQTWLRGTRSARLPTEMPELSGALSEDLCRRKGRGEYVEASQEDMSRRDLPGEAEGGHMSENEEGDVQT